MCGTRCVFAKPTLCLVRVQERRYREAILRDVSQVNTPSRSRTTPQHKPTSSGRRRHEIRRPPSSQCLLNEKYFKCSFLGFCHNYDEKVFRNGAMPYFCPAFLCFIPLFFLLPVKVNENELLPALLEELPHLHISPHSLGRMWEQQMQQAHRLRAAASPSSRRGGKLGSQVGQRLLQIRQEQQSLACLTVLSLLCSCRKLRGSTTCS